jgi:hypothetical protein
MYQLAGTYGVVPDIDNLEGFPLMIIYIALIDS